MNKLRQILKDQRGVAFPLIIAIVLVLVMLMCCISEYFRLLIVAQGESHAAPVFQNLPESVHFQYTSDFPVASARRVMGKLPKPAKRPRSIS